MALYDSSVLIDYLDARDEATAYVEEHLDERAVTVPLVLFEVYQGEVFKTGTADFDAVDGALGWVDVVDETPDLSRAAAELQQELAQDGTPFSPRDAFVAGAAYGLDERLVVADDDFDVQGLTETIDVDFLPERE